MNIQIQLNGVDITKQVLFTTFKISDSINSRSNQCNFNSYTRFEVGGEIVVMDGLNKIFAGVVVQVTNSIDYLRNNYAVTCKDYSIYLERKLVTERYTDKTVNEIITDLIATYADDFTMANVDCVRTIKSVTFNQLTIVDAIQRLAEQVNYSWYVDYNKDIHFFARSMEVAPFNLTETSKNFLANSLSITEDFSQLRNNIFVVGGETETEVRSEPYVADGNQKQFPLAYKYSVKPAVTVNGDAVTVGIDGIDLETDFDCFWSYGQKYIRFKDSTYPYINDAIVITGIPLFPILVKVPSSISIRKYGYYEYKIIDKNIKTRSDAVARGRVELEAYSNPIKEGNFKTYNFGLKSGQTITVSVGDITGTFTIQSVRLNMRTPYDGEYVVAISSLRTIGIITFLQKLLRDDEQVDENTTLLKLIGLTDALGMTDTLTFPSNLTSPPYVYDTAVCGFSTWG
jgi:hypothetical protein